MFQQSRLVPHLPGRTHSKGSCNKARLAVPEQGRAGAAAPGKMELLHPLLCLPGLGEAASICSRSLAEAAVKQLKK